MSQLNDLSRSLTSLEQDNTIIAVIEMSQSSWLVAGIVPGIERHPLKKLEPNCASIATRKQIDSTLDCSNASSSAGSVVNQITATW